VRLRDTRPALGDDHRGFLVPPQPVPISIVSTADCPDLAPLTASWRWDAFFRHTGTPLDAMVAEANQTAAAASYIPRTFVLLVGAMPVGTVSLAGHDFEGRPDLTPWLAGLFVAPEARRQGHATRLIAHVEQYARNAAIPVLWLYTNTAETLYARAGWHTVETVRDDGRPFALMRRDLTR
jgi:GNAT superfamily N-acetyltransferase